MICKDFQGLKSFRSSGSARCGCRCGRTESIDAEQAAAMTAEAIAKGVNLF